MKTSRQNKILEIIKDNVVSTQDTLQTLLRQAGISVNQATISRDMRELNVVKAADSNGVFRYIAGSAAVDSERKYSIIIKEAVISANCAKNIVIIKCHTGMAGAACAALDSMNLQEIAGTIAGDDTIMAVAYTDEAAQRILGDLNNIF